MNLFHLQLAEGNPLIVDRIERYSVDEYYTYLTANKKRVDEIKKQIEDAKKKSKIA